MTPASQLRCTREQRLGGTRGPPVRFRWQRSPGGTAMSAFMLYAIGFVVFVAGVLYAEHLLHVPQTWVLVSGLVLVGLGVMSAVSHTKRRDPPTQTP
jgi:hypothetical protein